MENVLKRYEKVVQTNTNNEIKTTQSRKEIPKAISINWWWVVYVKIIKVLSPLRKQKICKKSQEKDDKIKRKLHNANGNWNDWKFQLH